jgi:PAS domain S-box-containing protein
MRLDLRLLHKALLVAAVMFISELLFVSTLAILIENTKSQLEEDNRVRAIISHLADLSGISSVGWARASLHPLLVKEYLSPGQVILEDRSVTESKLQVELSTLKSLCKKHPQELDEIDELENKFKMGAILVDQYRRMHVTKNDRHLSARDRLLQQSEAVVSSTDRIIDNYKKLEETLIAERATTRRWLKLCLAAGAILNIVLALVVIRSFFSAITSRLDTLADNARRLSAGEPLQPLMSGNDETASLDIAFHQMADALADASRKENVLVHNAVDVICSLDGNKTFMSVSPASLSVWGYSPEELVGMASTDLLAIDEAEKFKSALSSLIDKPKQAPFETRLKHKDGRDVDLLWSARWSKRDKAFYCIAHDITDRKRAEKMLQESEARINTIIQYLPVGVVTVDNRGLIKSLNPRAEAIFGYIANELVDGQLGNLIESPLFERADQTVDGLRTMAVNQVLQLEAKRKNGEHFPIELSLESFHTIEGDHFLVIVQDITQRLQVERLKKEFVAMISHDLRTPLMSVEASLTLLSIGACGDLPEQVQVEINDAETDIEEVIRLTNGLLAIEKMSAGKLSENSCSLQTILDQCLQDVEILAKKFAITFSVEPTSATVFVNEDLLTRSLIILTSNALRLSQPGCQLALTAVMQDGATVVRLVQLGCPKSELSTLANADQISIVDSTRHAQADLGFAICKTMIERQGGSITMHNLEEQEMFCLRLPA